MYITADAGDALEAEDVKLSISTFTKAISRVRGIFRQVKRKSAPRVHGIGGPTSVDSTDVQKAQTIFTSTPDGRIRLKDYLAKVESEIGSEESARKRDVAAVRARMARNFAFNEAARRKLKKSLVAQMAHNAKKAKKELQKAMRSVQKQFNRAAVLANRRQAKNIKRMKHIRAQIARDRREATGALKTRVIAQARSMAALSSSINARIKKTDKSIAVNAAQIKTNAKAAQVALEKQVENFNKKAANAKALAAAGRSKLAAQLRTQAKATRQWANNKLKVVIAKTAAQFRRARDQMAKDRHHADFALKAATTRMSASLNAMKALNDKRFSKSVKDIKKARAEARAAVAKANTGFKVKIRQLRATVHEQVARTNSRISQLSGIVDKEKLRQAKVNNNVRAEMNRMIKVGNNRYKKHLKRDQELKRLIDSNQAATSAHLKGMAAKYSNELDKVRKRMKRNRAHATRMLAKKTSQLYSQIAKNEKAQLKTNLDISRQTRRARRDISHATHQAKAKFNSKMAKLSLTIIKNDRRFQKKMDRLAGVERRNALKNAHGRAHIAAMMKANQNDMKAAISDAVRKGTQRMQKLEMKMKGMDKATKSQLNMRISSQLSKYSKEAMKQVENYRQNSKAARKALKKELMYAVTAAAKEAKNNLGNAMKTSGAAFERATAQQQKAANENAAGRAKLAHEIAEEQANAAKNLIDAVGTMTRSLSALKEETRKKIKKSNRSITAYADRIKAEQKKVQAAMKANMNAMVAKIKKARASTANAQSAATSHSISQFNSVGKKIKKAMKAASAKSDKRFSQLFLAMAKQRADQNRRMASSIRGINEAIAKQAALADGRFSKTVTNIKNARKQATEQVKAARKSFATSIATTTSAIKSQESRLLGEVRLVGEQLNTIKQAQARITRRTNAEMKRISKLTNFRNSHSIRARGKLRRLLDENKAAASEEVKALKGLFGTKLAAIRAQATKNARAAGKDLKRSTKNMFTRLAAVQKRANMNNSKSAKAIERYEAESAAAIKSTQKDFRARLVALTNVVTANNKKSERGLEVLSGVIRNYKANGKKERQLIAEQTVAMNTDMRAKIARYVQEGEARAKKIAHHAAADLAPAKKAMLLQISARVESTCNNLFKTIQGNQKQLADNYLSLKAYAVTARDQLKEYTISGKGKNLASLGELLSDMAALSSVRVKACEGVGAGAKSIPAIFSAKNVKVKNTVNKINGLANEYANVVSAIRARWPIGLGKYLLMKLEESMLEKGVLQVDKVSGKSGNFVFVNGHTVGLSNKLNDFESLAVAMPHYEATLAKLTAMLAGKSEVHNKKTIDYVKKPEWPGN